MRIKIAHLLIMALACTSSSAWAKNLILYDFIAQEGERITRNAYADQELARLTRQGLAKAHVVPIDDYGDEITKEIQVLQPVFVPPLGIGTRILTSSVTWVVTTKMTGNNLVYENLIRTTQSFTNGMTLPTDQKVFETVVAGTAPANKLGKPVIAQTYDSIGGKRMLVGIIVP